MLNSPNDLQSATDYNLFIPYNISSLLFITYYSLKVYTNINIIKYSLYLNINIIILLLYNNT